MKLILVTSPNKSKSEIRHIVDFFENGLDILHVKKKGFTYAKMKDYLSMIPEKYRSKVVLHSHYYLAHKFNLMGIHISRHKKRRPYYSTVTYYIKKIFYPRLQLSKSFHSIYSMVQDKHKYDYVFLSPVFDHHDINVFSAAFSERQLSNVLYRSKHHVVALGGVSESRIELARRSGFYGVALHSTIWKEKVDRLALFKEIKGEIDRVLQEVN